MVCASGLKSVMMAAQTILSGDAEIVVAGGMESMSQAPYAFRQARWGSRMGNSELVDLMIYDGLQDVFGQVHMGITAENVAEQFGISREDQDRLALRSQENALKAQAEGGSGMKSFRCRFLKERGSRSYSILMNTREPQLWQI